MNTYQMIYSAISRMDALVWSWPTMLFIIGAGIACSYAFGWVQFRYFGRMWGAAFGAGAHESSGDVTPMQAFINTLSASLGNGAIAGMAVAIYVGGPGAAFWALAMTFLLMAIRFAEVYLSAEYGARGTAVAGLGGPMLYLQDVVGGRMLAQIYAISCLIFSFIGGNAAQANSICLSVGTTWHVPATITACVLSLVVLYIVLGGAGRIARASELIVPAKVIVFFVAAGALLVYHAASLTSALVLIFNSAFSWQAVAGGAAGFSLQQALRSGMTASTFATEAGLGTAAILFGFTGSKKPFEGGLMAMLGIFISSIVCFLVALCIVVSGVWNSGATSTALTISAFSTVFGQYGGWIVTFLSTTFGIGVIVAYAYITRAAWLYVTGGRAEVLFVLLYAAFAGLGALVKVDLVWICVGVVQAVMLLANLFGILCLLPRFSAKVAQHHDA